MKEGREEVGVGESSSFVLVGRMTSWSNSVVSMLLLSPSEDSRDVAVDRLTASPKSWASVRSALSMLRSE